MTVIWNDNCHATGWVNLRFNGRTFPLPATVVRSKRQVKYTYMYTIVEVKDVIFCDVFKFVCICPFEFIYYGWCYFRWCQFAWIEQKWVIRGVGNPQIRGNSIFLHNSYRKLLIRWDWNSRIGPSKKTGTPLKLSHPQYIRHMRSNSLFPERTM